MDSEKDLLLSLGDSAPSSPNVPVVQSLVQSKEYNRMSTPASCPLHVPEIEIEAGTPEKVSPPRPRQDHLDHSGSRHSLSKVFTQQQRKKEQRRQKSSQLPAH